MRKIYLSFFLLYLSAAAMSQTSLSNISAWAYQLQNMNVNAIAADSTFQLIVTDYSYDGTDAMKLSSADVATVRNSGKKYISYISIGEAENYRSYWQSGWTPGTPAWLGAENPNWPGNFKVKYWDTAWQQIIFAYIDTAAAQGFDGAYLDIIDGWYYWQHEVAVGQRVPHADSLMIDFVVRIRAHADAVTGNTNFILMPQNGEDLIYQADIDAAQRSQYFAAINAVGIEDVFFIGANSMDNNYAPDTFRLHNLALYQAHGTKVFNIEYLSQAAKIQQYKDSVTHYGFVPYYCDRALDRLCSGVALGIAEEGHTALALFPNPVTGDHIEFSTDKLISENTRIYLSDMQGRKLDITSSLAHGYGTDYNITIPAALSDGMYILSIQYLQGISATRIIIER
jgi:cysteinyl-tRNA synthetase